MKKRGEAAVMCEACHKEPATVHVTRIVNDQKTELHLCAQCAKERGEIEMNVEPSFAFHNILAGFFEPETVVVSHPSRPAALRCSNCGLSLADYRRIGKLGCSQCYAQFERELEPLLKRIHRSVEHTGKRPKRLAGGRLDVRREIERLRRELQEAIAREAYEEAARLRDQIRSLEQGL
ncbi:MAG: UvrB/UvrC motif-containing protein [Limnochordia bacterium]